MAKINIDSITYSTFDITGELASIGNRWSTWLRGFKQYAISRGVTDDIQKKNLLLVCAGPEVQELYDGLNPEDDVDEAEIEEGEETSKFQATVDILSKHFQPQVNVPFERHLFKQMTPEVGESVLKYIARLKFRAKTCQFKDSDDQIRDHVIHTVKSEKLRRKLLENGKDLKLDKLKDIAMSFEALANQMASMSVSEVNKVSFNIGSYEKTANKSKHRPTGKSHYKENINNRSSTERLEGWRNYCIIQKRGQD